MKREACMKPAFLFGDGTFLDVPFPVHRGDRDDMGLYGKQQVFLGNLTQGVVWEGREKQGIVVKRRSFTQFVVYALGHITKC